MGGKYRDRPEVVERNAKMLAMPRLGVCELTGAPRFTLARIRQGFGKLGPRQGNCRSTSRIFNGAS